MAYGVLNNLFSYRSFLALANEGYSDFFVDAVREYVEKDRINTNKDAIECIYEYMRKSYRNEYFFKNALLHKLVFGIHSPNTTSALCELPVAESVADFIMINGKAVVYEIKTDLDNFNRLESQVADYYKAFRYVNVVCSEDNGESLKGILEGSPVGLICLKKNGSFSEKKACKEYAYDLDAEVQFDILRKAERERIIAQNGFTLPTVSSAKYYRECLNLFKEISTCNRILGFENQLKNRMANIDLAAIGMIPEEYKLVAYCHKINVELAENVKRFFDTPCSVEEK